MFLSKSLFSTYTYHDARSPDELPEDAPPPPTFEISLPALLETLQIFSLSDVNLKPSTDSRNAFAAHRLNRHANQPFSSTVLGTTGLCRLTYGSEGDPLSVHLSEAGVSTTCDLTTYSTSSSEDIPFDRDALALKTIMRSSHLADAVTELSSTSPTTLSLVASPHAPYLSLSASGPLGSATVEFAKDPQLLETFQCARRSETSYSFAHVKAAHRAMGSASKVSLRADMQGVLSLQFLIEVESAQGTGDGDGVAFVDFRIVPLVEGEGEAEKDEHTSDEEDHD